MLESFLKRLENIGMAAEKLYRNTLKELFQVKNGLTASLLFFFLEYAKNLGGSDDTKRRKKRGWPYLKKLK